MPGVGNGCGANRELDASRNPCRYRRRLRCPRHRKHVNAVERPPSQTTTPRPTGASSPRLRTPAPAMPLCTNIGGAVVCRRTPGAGHDCFANLRGRRPGTRIRRARKGGLLRQVTGFGAGTRDLHTPVVTWRPGQPVERPADRRPSPPAGLNESGCRATQPLHAAHSQAHARPEASPAQAAYLARLAAELGW